MTAASTAPVDAPRPDTDAVGDQVRGERERGGGGRAGPPHSTAVDRPPPFSLPTAPPLQPSPSTTAPTPTLPALRVKKVKRRSGGPPVQGGGAAPGASASCLEDVYGVDVSRGRERKREEEEEKEREEGTRCYQKL